MTDPTPDELHRLLRQLADPTVDETPCEQVVARVCCYFEAVDRGAELTPEQHAIQRHLQRCGECRELYEVLRDACGCEGGDATGDAPDDASGEAAEDPTDDTAGDGG